MPHQANLRIIDAASHQLGIPADKVCTNLQRYGNTSCASIPLCLDEARETAGRLRAGRSGAAHGLRRGSDVGSVSVGMGRGVEPMGDLLLLFPGQGSQAVGMGRYLWETYAPLPARCSPRLRTCWVGICARLCLDGPIEELTRTDRAQPAIFVCSVAAWRVLEGPGV